MHTRKHKKLETKYGRYTTFFLITHLEFIFYSSLTHHVCVLHPLDFFPGKYLLCLVFFIPTTAPLVPSGLY